MKKRIEILAKKTKTQVSTFVAFLVLVIGVTGCTFSGAKEEKTGTEAGIETKAELEEAAEQTKEKPISASLKMTLEDVPEGAYCLRFSPDEICFQENFEDAEWGMVNNLDGVYYVPDEDVQKKIKELLDNPEKVENIPTEQIDGCEEPTDQWVTENIAYQEQWIKEQNQTLEAGYELLYKMDKEEQVRYVVNRDDTIMGEEYVVMVNPKLCNYLSKILEDEFQYETVEVTTIKDIESATLEYVHPESKKQYSQTIKDKASLDKFEDWFSNAKACYSGDRPYFNGLLTLKLKSGKVIKLTMASSGVSYFSVNGDLYDYGPENKPEGFDAYAVFACFDEIPYYNYAE